MTPIPKELVKTLCDYCSVQIFDHDFNTAVFVNVKQRQNRISMYCSKSCYKEDNEN
jgi:hypothetical protein